MESVYFDEVKKLIEAHKNIQDRNCGLLDIIQEKTAEIERLKEGERKLKDQVRQALQNVVNVTDLSCQYVAIKEDYNKVLLEKELLEQALTMKDVTYAREKDELLQTHEKQIKFYTDMVNKEQEKYILKEKEFSMELKKATALMAVQIEQAEQKWKGLQEEANRKLKESNISCNNLRSQLHQVNQKLQYTNDNEKRVRELEYKLDFKEDELRKAQQALYSKGGGGSQSPTSPPKHLYRTNAKRCSYRTTKQTTDSCMAKSKSTQIVEDEDNKKYVCLDATVSGKGDVVDITPVKGPSANTRKFKKRKLFDPQTYEYYGCPKEHPIN